MSEKDNKKQIAEPVLKPVKHAVKNRHVNVLFFLNLVSIESISFSE